MLGTRPEKPHNLPPLTIPVPRVMDYSEVQDTFCYLAVDNEHDRAVAMEDISHGLLEQALVDIHSVKSFLGTILRLANRTPYTDVSIKMKELLGKLEVLGLDLPVVRYKKGPSFYIPSDTVPTLDDINVEAYPVFVEAFLNDCRVSHMVQVMGFHPKYLKWWVQTHHFLLRGPSLLPQHERAYIGIMAASRHHCVYTVNLLEREFRCFGGDPQWLQGVKHIPQKLRNLINVNNILCHRPWQLTSKDIKALLTGADSWSKSELTQALVLACHFHSLSTFVLGCGLTQEIDSSAGHTYGTSPSDMEEAMLLTPDDTQHRYMFEDIFSRLIKPQDMHHTSSDDNTQIFENLQSEQRSVQAGETIAVKNASNAVAHYIENPGFKHEVPKGPQLKSHDFDWDEAVYPCTRDHYNTEIADILDEKFKAIKTLTYKTMGSKENIDTAPLRNAVWYYVQQLEGIYYDDFNYATVETHLTPPFRAYIRNAVCCPENISRESFESMAGFKISERVHFCLIMMEARFQAGISYALRAIRG